MDKKKIVAISGSTRRESTNLNLIKVMAALSADDAEFILFDGLSSLPHFNPDDDTENISPSVAGFRKQLRDADGVVICTPEYAMGLPGTLKNALDWTVSSGEFQKKPVAAITASLSGQKAHESLLAVLTVLEAVINEHHLLIPYARTKIKGQQITDEKTVREVQQLMASFIRTLHEPVSET